MFSLRLQKTSNIPSEFMAVPPIIILLSDKYWRDGILIYHDVLFCRQWATFRTILLHSPSEW